jgi:hypothetical protein
MRSVGCPARRSALVTSLERRCSTHSDFFDVAHGLGAAKDKVVAVVIGYHLSLWLPRGVSSNVLVTTTPWLFLFLDCCSAGVLCHAISVAPPLCLVPRVVGFSARPQVLNVQLCLPSRLFRPSALSSFSGRRCGFVFVVARFVAAPVPSLSVVEIFAVVTVSCGPVIASSRHAQPGHAGNILSALCQPRRSQALARSRKTEGNGAGDAQKRTGVWRVAVGVTSEQQAPAGSPSRIRPKSTSRTGQAAGGVRALGAC